MPIKPAILFFTGLSSSVALVVLFRTVAIKHKLLLHPKGIPLTGGIALGIAFFISCPMGSMLYPGFSKEISAILLASAIMLIFGIIDDWQELSVAAKFITQICAAGILIFSGIKTRIVNIGDSLNLIVSFIWIIGITNAFNHLDVMDGLAAGIGLMVSLAFMGLSLINHDLLAMILSLALAAALTGFLFFNLPPARVFMGNAGSHFTGFVISAISLVVSYAPLERKIALLSPIIILGLPILDTLFLILIRLKKKWPVFRKNDDHPALRLLRYGLSKRKALLIMLMAGLFFVICGVLLSKSGNVTGIAIVSAVFLFGLIFMLAINNLNIDA